MKVSVDNIWSSNTTLHMRVDVWANDYSWRHRHDVAVPFEDICEEALEGLFARFAPPPSNEELMQLGLW